MFRCSFDEFVGEKAVSPSYSSAILAPPMGAANLKIRLVWLESILCSGPFFPFGPRHAACRILDPQ